jgi:hypothetical protein
MRFLHSQQYLGPGDGVEVVLSHQARVILLDAGNYHAYCNNRSYTYYGGWRRQSPVLVRPPHHGSWHVIVDLDGRYGRVRANIRAVRAAA